MTPEETSLSPAFEESVGARLPFMFLERGFLMVGKRQVLDPHDWGRRRLAAELVVITLMVFVSESGTVAMRG